VCRAYLLASIFASTSLSFFTSAGANFDGSSLIVINTYGADRLRLPCLSVAINEAPMTKIVRKFGLAIPTAAFLLLYPLAVFAQPAQFSSDRNGPGPWHSMWGFGWGFGWIFPLFMLLLIVVCVLFMMRGPWGHGRRSSTDATSSALQILNERFAKGEIKKEEYEEKKAAILR
jgi:putative membrane protein